MYILTFHRTLLASDIRTGRLVQLGKGANLNDYKIIDLHPEEIQCIKGILDATRVKTAPFKHKALSGFQYVSNGDGSEFNIVQDGYLCALPDAGELVLGREIASSWESFRFIEAEFADQILRPGEDALKSRVTDIISKGSPLLLHLACGPRRLDGYLNIDRFEYEGDTKDYFLFPFAEKTWPIPDASVDYIYSEDFVEHITQRSQVGFLAEAFRVLKAGAYHRICTPCLEESLREHSDFSKGMAGVYFDEFDKWQHVSILTRGFVEDIARAIGYRRVFFTTKGKGSSPYAVQDLRPNGDRDDITGNLFADLLR